MFDRVHGALPLGLARSLEPHDVHAISACLLYSSHVVSKGSKSSRGNCPFARFPYEDTCFMDDRAEGEIPASTRGPCMSSGTDSAEITARAAMLDIAPSAAVARRAIVARDAAIGLVRSEAGPAACRRIIGS